MKQYILLALTLIVVSSVFGQDEGPMTGPRQSYAERARLFKTYTTFTATSDDTSGWVTIACPGFESEPLLMPEVYLIAVATDSVAADIYVLGRNNSISGTLYGTDDSVGTATSPYADSLRIYGNVVKKVITLKSSTVNRLPGSTQFRVGTVFRAAGQGTTAGRTLKWYVMWNKP